MCNKKVHICAKRANEVIISIRGQGIFEIIKREKVIL